MKKLVFAFLTILIAFSLLVACANETPSDDKYEYSGSLTTLKAQYDEDTVIDGRLTEDRWQGLEWIQHKVPEISIKVTASFSEKGFYVGAIIKDRNIVYNMPYAGEDNSGLRIYVAPMDDYELKNRITAYFDAGNTPFLTGAYVHSSFVTVQGEGVNTNRSEGMTLECFFPWKELGLEEKPENIRLTFCYNQKLTGGLSGRGKKIYPALSDGTKLGKYFIFGENGYAEADAEDAVLGDSVFGYSKSTDWKEIREADGSLTLKSNYTGQRLSDPAGRYIFFRNVYARSYIFSGVLKPNIDPVQGAGIDNSTPRLGIIAGFDPTYGMTGAYFDLRKQYLDTGRIAFGHMNYFFEKWDIASVSQYKFDNLNKEDAEITGKLNANYTNGIPFTVIKDGAMIYYFLGKGNSCYLAYIDKQDYMGGDTAFGFYSFAADVDITDIEFQILDGIDGEGTANLSVDELAAKYNVYRINVMPSNNGYVSTDVYGGKYGTGFNLSVAPYSSDYVLSSLIIETADGAQEEYVDEIDANMKDGLYYIGNVTGDITIKPQFEKADTAVVSGKVTVEGAGNEDCEIILESVNHKSRVYKTNSVAGMYNIRVPMDKYKVYYIGKYCSSQVYEADIYSDWTKDVTVLRLAVGGNVTVNGKTLSSATGWNTETGGKVVKPETTDHNSILWFRESGADENFAVTASLSVKLGSDSDPNGGFVISDGSNTICISILNNGYRVYSANDFDGRYQVRNVSGMANLLTGDVTITLKKQGATYYLYADYPDNVTGEATKLIGSFGGTLTSTNNPAKSFTMPSGDVAVGLSFRTGATVTYYDMAYSA